MAASIEVYYFPPSPPSRIVLLVAKTLGLSCEQKVVNIMKGENMTEEYKKINPQCTIPTINDNGFIVWESRAIIQYLSNAYGKDDSMAPKDPKAAALVNQRLYFDATTLFPRIDAYFRPIMFMGEKPDPEKSDKVEEALGLLNNFLENQVWVAGQYLTIADFSIVVSISTAEAVGFDIAKYPNIWAWYQRCQKAMDGYDEINQSGADMIAKMYKSKIESI